MGFHPAGAGRSGRSALSERLSTLDLTAFAPRVVIPRRLWRHAIRVLDPQSRVRVHELVDLAGFDGTNLVTVLRRDVWELRAATPRGASTPVDSQHRVSVPVGVRHQLGLQGPVLVSLAADRSRIVISSSVRLDTLLEAPS